MHGAVASRQETPCQGIAMSTDVSHSVNLLHEHCHEFLERTVLGP